MSPFPTFRKAFGLHAQRLAMQSETTPLRGESRGPPPAYFATGDPRSRASPPTSGIHTTRNQGKPDERSPSSPRPPSYTRSSPRDILDPIERENIRREWNRERANHDAEHKQWGLERKEYDKFKRLWRNEQSLHDTEVEGWVRQRRQWELEKARHEAEDQRWEKERWERMRLYWGPLWRNDHCHAYATREYTARLWNIAPGADGLAACKQMSMTINRRSIFPSECEDRSRDGIHGRWLVDYDETACRPYWNTLQDKGCVGEGAGLHRFEARLENIQSGDDWQRMCDTAPNIVNGIKFDSPTSCENRGWWSGMVGIWDTLMSFASSRVVLEP
ncbi:hypothetical protein BC629DRAFT_1599492 [Irpex lacteus]|nr:hypothetical protein BC629DRAFT_1599492 [Irpex lacteus]